MCGGRFTTFERVQLRELTVVKRSGRRVPFDRDKLMRSVQVALRKRPVEPERVERMINGIVRQLESMGDSEIPSELIGDWSWRASSASTMSPMSASPRSTTISARRRTSESLLDELSTGSTLAPPPRRSRRKDNPSVPSPDRDLDERLMAAALRLGRRNLGRTYPNPAVGALIVHPEVGGPRVVGRGWTAVGGRPHAEIEALAQAGDAAAGATAYVTLEPCAHDGRAPPCATALVKAGVARVVTTMEDPDPRVAGRGHAILEAAGIAVTTGVLTRQARIAHGGHINRITKGRPWITLKLAVSADGMIGRREGERMIITGRPAVELVQAIRADSDAVMVGMGTVEVDDPRLTVRLPGTEPSHPIRVILDTQARIGPSTNLVQTARDVPLWLVVAEDADPQKVAALEDAGAILVKAPRGTGGLDLAAVFSILAGRGLTRVLVEGGSRVAASMVSLGLADEVILFRAEVIVGPDGVRALAGNALSAIERSPRFELIDDHLVGEDRLRRYLRVA